MKPVMIISCSLLSFVTFSQENTVVTGGTGTGANGSATYSVGQVVYQQEVGSTGELNQGVQQPFELFTVNIIETTLFNLSVYPNPTVQQVTLTLGEVPTHTYSYALMDFQGKLIQTEVISEQNTTIDLTECAKATYLLRIMDKQATVSVIEIIKN